MRRRDIRKARKAAHEMNYQAFASTEHDDYDDQIDYSDSDATAPEEAFNPHAYRSDGLE